MRNIRYCLALLSLSAINSAVEMTLFNALFGITKEIFLILLIVAFGVSLLFYAFLLDSIEGSSLGNWIEGKKPKR